MNLHSKKRTTTIDEGNKQLNLFNKLAIEARVPFVPGRVPNRMDAINEYTLSTFFPTKDDQSEMELEFK